MIPKVIHYCWLSNDTIPEDLKTYMGTWKEKLPDYEFIKWDFERFHKKQSLWVSQAFDNKKYAFACDYIRIFAIYHYGGIYMDMDMEVLKSFNNLIEKEYMFARERESEDFIEAGCFGAEKHDEFLGYCLDYYKDKEFIKNDGSFDMKPLPQIMAQIIKENDIKLDLYPWKYFTAKSYATGKEYPDNSTYSIHHFAGSWKTDDEKILISEAQKLTSKYGKFLGRNIAEYKLALKKGGVKEVVKLTKIKLNRKFKTR